MGAAGGAGSAGLHVAQRGEVAKLGLHLLAGGGEVRLHAARNVLVDVLYVPANWLRVL